MADSAKIYEGVFAIHKPKGVTSAGVLRALEEQFNPSKTFAPWINAEKATQKENRKNQKWQKRRSKGPIKVKMGHGGTLDPLATGVLIVGVGKGTKFLSNFLACTKSYEAGVLFGAATDTYDMEGKIVARKPYGHITKELVEEKLGAFRGEIMQVPPVYSALNFKGKRLYEIAREGGEIPDIPARKVTVEKLEITEWLEPGTHEYNWPKEESSSEEKAATAKLLHLEDEPKGTKRKRDDAEPEPTATETTTAADSSSTVEPEAKKARPDTEPSTAEAAATETSTTAAAEPEADTKDAAPETATSAPEQVASEPTKSVEEALPQPPAARISMTVTSGFYVRSLCHDLGRAVDSVALMSSLVRTRQGEFELGKNVLEYEDLEKGEEVWGPKVRQFLEDWQERHK